VAKGLFEYRVGWGSRGAIGQEYYQCSLAISEVARLDCAERELSYLRPWNSDL